MRYPYGCVEQTTSKCFPLVYFNDLAKEILIEAEEFGIDSSHLNHVFTRLYLTIGDFEEAKKLFTEVKNVPGFEMNANASLGALNEIMGNPKIAIDYLEQLLSAEETETGHDISFNIAYIYAYLDKPDEMFQYLNNSIDKKDISVLYIQVLPSFKRYNQDPRFDKLVKKIGLK